MSSEENLISPLKINILEMIVSILHFRKRVFLGGDSFFLDILSLFWKNMKPHHYIAGSLFLLSFALLVIGVGLSRLAS